MSHSYELDIRIVEYRNIIKVIRDTYEYDFNDYALTSLKRRFEKVIIDHNLKSAENLISRILEDNVFFDQFLEEIAIEGEMFRDPSLWRYLRDELFPVLFKENSRVKIWLPSCVSGNELYTLTILLDEAGWLDNVEIIATCGNQSTVDKIKSGILKSDKIDVSTDNYSRYQGEADLKDYYTIVAERAIRDLALIKNVNFQKQNINFDNSPKDVKLVIFRNQMIYYNQNLQDKVLKVIHESIVPGGYLTIGLKEQLGIKSSSNFRVINANENVYRKK